MWQDRRKFVILGLQNLGIAALGSLVWSAQLDAQKKAPLILRPPGALDEKEFLAHCIRCGLCVQACPFHTLKLAAPGDDAAVGTPFFTPRKVPCYMCRDIPCVPACPSGALSLAGLLNDKNVMQIAKARMGVAVIDENACIAYWGIQCDACYRACPLLGEAITIENSRNVRTGKHAFLAPKIQADICTGCGMCEKACVTKKASIFVLPRKVALGEAGSIYIKGWVAEDEKRLENAQQPADATKQGAQKAVDYLNKEEL